MLLRNFMEEKQLDYNQPFLSARRFSPTVASSDVKDNKQADNSHNSIPALPFYKSDLKSGPVRTAGTVPFTWEKSPGRPKDERKLQIQALERPPISPKLPPGRIANVKKQTIFKVPQDPVLDRPQTGNALSSSNNVSSSNENVTIFERSKKKLEEKQSFCSEDGDEAYMDALDTLSRSESFFLNCSVSGLSGLDGLDAKQSGTFNTDPETRDFMMGRFLPAAKAMASETPPYASRRQPVARDQSRQRKNLVSEDKQPPVYRLKPNALPYYSHNSVEENVDDGDSDAHKHLSGKVCGLLPRFCLNNSFFLMNPVPEMRIGARVPASSVRRVPAKSSYAGSRSESEEQFKDAYQGRSVGGLPKTEVHEDMSNHKGGSNHINSRKPDGSSLYRRLQGGGISSYQHEFSQSVFHEDKEFLSSKEANNFRVNGVGSHKKVQNSFRDLLVDQSTKSDSGSASPVVEKTLYIDSVHIAESRNSNLSSSDTKGGMDTREIDSEILLKSGEMEEISSVESSLQDVKDLSLAGENVTSKHQTLESDYSCLISSPGGTNQVVKMEVMKDFREDQDLMKDSISLEGSIVSDVRKTNHENHQHPKTDRTEYLRATFPEFPLPPPLPKSPSESWLFRTLPSASLRSQPSRSFLGMQKHQSLQASKKTVLDPKWETIVKTSEQHHGYLRFSEEQLTPIPEK